MQRRSVVDDAYAQLQELLYIDGLQYYELDEQLDMGETECELHDTHHALKLAEACEHVAEAESTFASVEESWDGSSSHSQEQIRAATDAYNASVLAYNEYVSTWHGGLIAAVLGVGKERELE